MNLSASVVALLVIWWFVCLLDYLFVRYENPFSLADYLLDREAYVKWYEAQVQQAAKEFEETLERQIQDQKWQG